jgi:hypothetical protein
MTTTHDERQRLAAMANALRPDWQASSLYTHLTREHAPRGYRDLAVALAWIACDPDTKTPARLLEPGPWWSATRPADRPQRQPVAITGRCTSCRGLHHPADECVPASIDRSSPARAAAKDAARRALRDRAQEDQ